MSFHQKHGNLPDVQAMDTFYNNFNYFNRIKPDSNFMITANGQFSDASIVPLFLKNQTFEFQASGKHLEEFAFHFSGHNTVGPANVDVEVRVFLI